MKWTLKLKTLLGQINVEEIGIEGIRNINQQNQSVNN